MINIFLSVGNGNAEGWRFARKWLTRFNKLIGRCSRAQRPRGNVQIGAFMLAACRWSQSQFGLTGKLGGLMTRPIRKKWAMLIKPNKCLKTHFSRLIRLVHHLSSILGTSRGDRIDTFSTNYWRLRGLHIRKAASPNIVATSTKQWLPFIALSQSRKLCLVIMMESPNLLLLLFKSTSRIENKQTKYMIIQLALSMKLNEKYSGKFNHYCSLQLTYCAARFRV